MKLSVVPRKKSAILDRLERLGTTRHYEGHLWLFCFNVKASGIDLSFNNLLRRLTAMGYGDAAHPEDAIWLSDAMSRYKSNKDNLFEWGIDDARLHFRGNTVRGPFACKVEGAPWYADMRPEGDCCRMLKDGTSVDARFAFFGRSGGWLTLTMFDGETMDRDCDLFAADYQWLRRLLSFLTDLSSSIANPEQWIEEAAAFTFFANICDDCETKASRMEEWARDQSGEH